MLRTLSMILSAGAMAMVLGSTVPLSDAASAREPAGKRKTAQPQAKAGLLVPAIQKVRERAATDQNRAGAARRNGKEGWIPVESVAAPEKRNTRKPAR